MDYMDNIDSSMINNSGQRVNNKPLKKTLEQLVEINKIVKAPDLQLIKDWFVINNLEEEGIRMLAELSFNKLIKVETSLNSIRNWDVYLQDVWDNQLRANKNDYDKETADNLTRLERVGLLNEDLKSYFELYEWAKENVPNLICPKQYYIPTFHYLAKYGIYFKDMPKEEVDKYKHIKYEDAAFRE